MGGQKFKVDWKAIEFGGDSKYEVDLYLKDFIRQHELECDKDRTVYVKTDNMYVLNTFVRKKVKNIKNSRDNRVFKQFKHEKERKKLINPMYMAVLTKRDLNDYGLSLYIEARESLERLLKDKGADLDEDKISLLLEGDEVGDWFTVEAEYEGRKIGTYCMTGGAITKDYSG